MTSKIRILHIVGDSRFGGASQSILRLGRFWQSLGWEVGVLATDPQFCAAAAREGVPVVPLDVIRREIRPVRDLLGLIRLLRYLRTADYTVVHTHTTKAGFVGRLAAWMAGIPIVLHTAHGFAFHEKSPWWRIAFYVVLERVASLGCKRVIAVSRFHQEWGRRLGVAASRKIISIPNGIPEPAEISPRERAKLRESCGVAPDETMLLSTGRLAPEKGIEDLIDAVALLSARPVSKAKYRLVIAGDGPLSDMLKARVADKRLQDKVVFLGFRADIPRLLAAADVFVLPTWREGLSIALLEAMASGSAIVTTTIGSNREATENGRAAVLVRPGCAEQLAAAIEKLAISPEDRRQLGVCAREIYRAKHTIRRMMSDYEQVYLELLKEVDNAESISPLLSSVDR